MHKCILILGKHCPPLALIMQTRGLYCRGRLGMEGDGDLFAGGFCAAWQSYAVD